MTAHRVDAGFLRKSLDRQVEEGLDLIGEPTPARRWAGGFLIGGRAFTTAEIADRLLQGGAAGATGQAETLLTRAAARAPGPFAALGMCPACPEHRDVAAHTAKVFAVFGIVTATVCAPCADQRRTEGYTVVPLTTAAAVE